MARLKVAVLISGRGSNLQSLIDAQASSAYPAEIVSVISNVPDAPGLTRAARAGVPTRVVDHRRFEGREEFEAALNAAIEEAGVQLVCLAGFMRLLTPGFVEKWRDRLINIHPSLLPAFKGLHTHERAIKAGVKFAGCTVHYVRPEMDEGPIIIQAAVPVAPDDTPDVLAARVLNMEHRIYPFAVRLIAEGKVRVNGERVEIEGAYVPEGAVTNPSE
jgi:phosphoribosylglycinamide formyltransferase-1